MRMPWASRPSAPAPSVRARSVRAVSLLALPLALLAGCGTKTAVEQPFIANIPSPLPDNIPFLDVPPPPPILINQNKGEDLWHLRSGLNVAVLLCQDADNAAMVAAYNRVLTTHKGLLSSAAQTEVDLYRAKGGKKWQDAYDDHMTKIYNAYSGTLTREAFCAKSKAILNEVGNATPELFSERATVMLWDLNKAAGLPDPDGKLARAAMQQTASATPPVQTSQATVRP